MLIRHTTNGQIDTMFGNGAMTLLFANVATIALRADGKILVGSGSTLGFTGAPGSLSGYNGDGSIEFFFGVQGEIADVVGPAAVGVQGAAQIITAGTITSSLSLSRTSTGFGLTGWRSRPKQFHRGGGIGG